MEELVALRPKTYSYLTDDGYVYKKAKKGAKKHAITCEIKFEDYKFFLKNNKIILKSHMV